MLSFSNWRSPNTRRRRERSPFSSTYTPTTRSPETSRNTTQRTREPILEGREPSYQEQYEGDTDEEEDVSEEDGIDDEEELDEDDFGDDGEPGDEDDAARPLLPIFSAARLDAIPVFAVTHAIRMLVTTRCDTVLTWEQLRAPQISQFLVKPIEQDIRDHHLNAATQYALMANCLQYSKEATLSPGNSGTNKTRAMVCELLAIKLLKDFSTRELIDALSYDFDPLQGQADSLPQIQEEHRGTSISKRVLPRQARISCFEIAIRAQAKKFLSHPMVVRQLEAIWAGSIVFHSVADNLHRHPPATKQIRNYGTTELQSSQKPATIGAETQLARRTVTLYNPRDASLFKLSRLRVPRYRNILSTLSFAVLLSLFVAVLVERSLEITTLEVVFWFWAAGYMLDEILGFNEQGFSLYLASFWNTFDLGILILLLVHLVLRLYGILMPDVRKHYVANMAYDVLAADAILLFPRLFSVLDHYRYFSPLLIAFRYMAVDLIAVSLLILISCSGFFVALTLSFGNDQVDTPSSVAYALLQMLMGFTPAAWDRWNDYNLLGKTILTLFLFICHFLVVTILITVLTNSFMAVVRNANEEHQFLFAVNTISHVKSDALFSYVAPTNILQWLLVPLRYCVPFRQYVKINRTMIKATHLPLLFSIFVYEKTILQTTVFDRIDLVDDHARAPRTSKFTRLAKAPSIATFRQDRALEEVFRQPFDATLRTARQNNDQRSASNVVDTWMNKMGDDDAEPPQEQDRLVVDRLEARKTSFRKPRPFSRIRDFSHRTMSVVSDPAEAPSNPGLLSSIDRRPVIVTPSAVDEPPHQSDVDGDDELHSNDDYEEEATTSDHRSEDRDATGLSDTLPVAERRRNDAGDKTPKAVTVAVDRPPIVSPHQAKLDGNDSGATSPLRRSPKNRPHHHSRNISTTTMIFKPMLDSGTEQSSSVGGSRDVRTRPQAPAHGSGSRTPVSKHGSHAAGHRTPKRAAPGPTRMRPVLPDKSDPAFRSTPNLGGLLSAPAKQGMPRRRPSLELDLVSDIGDNQAVGGGFVGALPHSVAAQLARESRHSKDQKDQQEMFTKIMMARMNSLEEGFRDVIHEMRGNLRQEDGENGSRGRVGKGAPRKERPRERDDAEAAMAKWHTSSRPSPNPVGGAFGQQQRTPELETGQSQIHEDLREVAASDRPASR